MRRRRPGRAGIDPRSPFATNGELRRSGGDAGKATKPLPGEISPRARKGDAARRSEKSAEAVVAAAKLGRDGAPPTGSREAFDGAKGRTEGRAQPRVSGAPGTRSPRNERSSRWRQEVKPPMASEAVKREWRRGKAKLRRSASPALNQPNRRMRTRMSGGVGGERRSPTAAPYPDSRSQKLRRPTT